MTSPRVLYLVDDFPSPSFGGTEAQFWLLYTALDKPTWRPRVVTLRPSPYLATALGPAEYGSLDVTSLKSPTTWWRAWRCALAARREGFRVAHLYLNDVSVLMPPLLRLAGLRVIVSRRDLGFWYTPGLLKALRFVRRFVDRVVANCTAVKQAVCEAEGYRSSQVEVILNGYVPPAASTGVSSFRTAAGVPKGAVVFGMVANLRPLKRVDDAIRALAALPAAGLRPWLLVAGEDRPQDGRSAQSVLTELATELGVADRVRFVGPVAEPWPFLQEVDVFLSCSDTEGLSNSIIEAMAVGKPVVGSAVGGTPELIEEGVTGYLYPARDVATLTARLGVLVADPGLRARLGASASAMAEARLSVRALVEHHERLYRSLGAADPIGELSPS